MKIKIFNCAGTTEDVEKEVNTFIRDKKVIDMKFSADSKNGFVDWGWLFVMYEAPIIRKISFDYPEQASDATEFLTSHKIIDAKYVGEIGERKLIATYRDYE